jgi:hypothetical protein
MANKQSHGRIKAMFSDFTPLQQQEVIASWLAMPRLLGLTNGLAIPQELHVLVFSVAGD